MTVRLVEPVVDESLVRVRGRVCKPMNPPHVQRVNEGLYILAPYTHFMVILYQYVARDS